MPPCIYHIYQTEMKSKPMKLPQKVLLVKDHYQFMCIVVHELVYNELIVKTKCVTVHFADKSSELKPAKTMSSSDR
jgi:hypothetical protein